ncbi:DUF1284 domain-containing protein [Salinicola halophilus]|uniref:DUF1284 domain-containing protein n=1 Tax=Salinicola halophilus TaxID=184065 RepID=UPI000DA12883|nr:DUF1284 domain-containing protein [Salinicola halophilus]
MSVALRAHHLLCVLTYVGRGYSEAFVANYDALARRIIAGEPIRLVAGPDDICAPLLAPTASAPAHCRQPSVVERDAAARHEVAALLGRALAVGDTFTLDADTLSRLRDGFRANEIRTACVDCQWSELCTSVADGGYRDVRIVAAPTAESSAT